MIKSTYVLYAASVCGVDILVICVIKMVLSTFSLEIEQGFKGNDHSFNYVKPTYTVAVYSDYNE